MNRRATTSGESNLEIVVSYVFVAGAATSLLFVMAGMFLFYREYSSMAISHGGTMFLRGKDLFLFLAATLKGNKLLFAHRGGHHGYRGVRPDTLHQGPFFSYLFCSHKEREILGDHPVCPGIPYDKAAFVLHPL